MLQSTKYDSQNLPYSNSKTGVIFQDFSLFIEGVQVPFSSIVVNSGVGTTPSASITVPPQIGLMDISKFYSPKVHIFYRDITDGTNKNRLLFSGIITGVSFTKNIDNNSKFIEFQCQHKYFVINDFLIDYSGWLNLTTDHQQNGSMKPSSANSKATVLNAMKGIADGVDPENEVTEKNWQGKTTVLPTFLKDFKRRLIGIPGIIVNYWQQLKQDTFNPDLKPVSDSFVKLYRPLFEDGLKFFQRMTGHSYIEQFVETGRIKYDCKDETKNVVIPPSSNTFLISSVQAEMSYRIMNQYLSNSGEVTNLYQIFSALYESIDYEMITLTSPAETSNMEDGSTYAVDTIVKPKMPFYYSPSCNVIYPNMYSAMSIQYDDYNIPTRIELNNQEMPGGGEVFFTRFRAPHSVRKAIAEGVKKNEASSLHSTTGPSQGKVGRYEQGRGIKREIAYMPPWLAHMSSERYADIANESWPTKDGSESDAIKFYSLEKLKKGWETRYPHEEAFNPWSEKQSGILAHHRLLFTTADYYYTQLFARSKMGSVQGAFNPYIIAGYPMDVLGGSPTDPCIHAYCTSVSHTITANSVYTSISFAAAMTYSELVNYYVPFVHPWMQVHLDLAEKQTLVNNEEGRITANGFYNGTLGRHVYAVSPDMLYDFNTGLVKPQGSGNFESSIGSNGGELNPNLTYEGNLSFVYREIESQDSITEREGKVFIPLQAEVYNPTVLTYTDDALIDESRKFEIGQSQFLSYNKYLGE